MSSICIEDKKTWLRQGLELQTELQALRETRKQIYEDATHITGRISASRGSGSRNIHRFDKLAEIDDFIKIHEKELLTRRKMLLDVIYSMDDSMSRTVLTYRYVDGFTWAVIAEKINYTEPRCHAFHNKALAQIQITPGMIESMRAAHGYKH